MAIVIHTIKGNQYAYEHHRVGKKVVCDYLGPRGGGEGHGGRLPQIASSQEVTQQHSQIDDIKEGETVWIGDRKVTHSPNEEYKWTIEERVFGRDVQKVFPTKESADRYLRGEIKGIRFEEPILTKDKVKIVDLHKSSYKQQDMPWTEEQTGSYTTSKEEIAYHISTEPIKRFGAKNTAFYREGGLPYNYIKNGYAVKIPAGTEVYEYGNNEIRVHLNPSMEIYKLKPGWRNYEEHK